jgi:citryl-CoA lyase
VEFKTEISKTSEGKHKIRGYDLTELIKNKSFTDVIFLLWRGDFPSKEEKELLNAVLVAAVENGIAAPSIFTSRVSASVGNPMHLALASGILATGERHGGAVEKCAEILQSGLSPEEILSQFKMIPGFGHKIYKDEDPRASEIYQKAKSTGLSSKYFDLAYKIESKLENKKGKKLPLNIDGAMAAAMLEMKLDYRLGKALFSLSRLVGSAAHIVEEYNQNNSYYRLEESDIEN